ncbi:MBL fold metallo-hydrolase [soil metagenome]
MRLDVLGSSGTYPARGRPAAGYLISQGDTRVWCDTGPGTYVALPIESELVTAIVISHEHPDHWLDLVTAFHAVCYGPNPRQGIPVFAPQSTIDHVLGIGGDDQFEGTFDFNPLAGGDTIQIGEIDVGFAWSDHSVPTVASRWEANGRVFAYSADTGPGGDWDKIAAEADLFLCEASYQGDMADYAYQHHLTASLAGTIARRQGAKKLMLTHIPPHLDPTLSVNEAETSFDRPVDLAVPGLTRKI